MLIWGSIGVFVKQIQLPSLELAFLRALIGALFIGFAGFRLKQNKLKISKQNIIFLLIAGIAIGFNWIFLFQGYQFTTIANATLSYYCAPVFIILLSPIVLRERFTLLKLISVVGAMSGLFLILSCQTVETEVAYNHFKGISYALCAAILYAGIILINKKMNDLPAYEMTLIEISLAALVLLPFIVLRNNLSFSTFQIGRLIPIFILGTVHTGLAYMLYFSSLKKVKAQDVAILSYLDPISAVIFGAIFLSEPINIWQIVGGTLILFSTLLAEVLGKRQFKN